MASVGAATVNTTAKSRGFGLPRKAGRFAWFVGVGIAIGVAIAIAIGSELKRTEMRDGASCSILDCDCDPDRTAWQSQPGSHDRRPWV